jgi:hypothetical protein
LIYSASELRQNLLAELVDAFVVLLDVGLLWRTESAIIVIRSLRAWMMMTLARNFLLR